MRTSTWLKGSAAVAVALALTACSTSSNTASPATTTPAPASSSSTPIPTPTTKSPEEVAADNAEAVYREYLRAQSRCLSDPLKTLPTCFDNVAIGTERNTSLQALRAAQEVGSKVSGEVTIVSIKTTKVDLTNKIKENPPTVPKVVFSVCMDVSKFNIVDKDGKSIVPPSRKPHVPVNVTVYNYQLPDPAQWRVGVVDEVKDGSC